MVADKRSGIKFGSCGVTEGLGLTVEVRCALWHGARGPRPFLRCTNNDSDWPCVRDQAAASGVKPHVPPATANRVDNLGNWGAGDHD
jgi:hypothetical protein